MAVLCEIQRSLSDRCSISFLSTGGPTGESLVTTAACLLGDLWCCSCDDNTEGVVFAFVPWLTLYLSSVRHHSKLLLMQSYPLNLLKSSHIRRA